MDSSDIACDDGASSAFCVANAAKSDSTSCQSCAMLIVKDRVAATLRSRGLNAVPLAGRSGTRKFACLATSVGLRLVTLKQTNYSLKDIGSLEL